MSILHANDVQPGSLDLKVGHHFVVISNQIADVPCSILDSISNDDLRVVGENVLADDQQ